MQQKNTILFLVLSMLILATWFWAQQHFWPPPPRKDSTPPAAKLWPWEKATTATQLQILGSLVGQAVPPSDPARIALGLSTPFFPQTPPLRWTSFSPAMKMALLSVPPSPLGPEVFGQLAHLVPVAAADKVSTVVLKGAKFHMDVRLTTRGAGIEKLVLNKFKAANWLGHPTDTDLELIQEDTIVPSFLMYHYAAPGDERPKLDLGERNWKLESHIDKEDVQEASFSTEVPGYERLRIVKTYRMEPATYHLGMTLEIVDDREVQSKQAARTFRYQLAGARGLPVEGEWYTSTFRNAAIGRVDPRNNLVRDLEDSARISHRGGGDKVPESGELGDNFIQYAGVMNQFFGSILVSEDKKNEGSDPRKVIAWARPTVESTELPGRIHKVSKTEIVFEFGQSQRETFVLLPRVVTHIDELELKEGQRAVISFYETGDRRKVATWIRRGQTPRTVFDDITVRVQSQELSLHPGERLTHHFVLYNGPVKVRQLEQMTGNQAVSAELVNRYASGMHLDTLTDYGKFMWWSDLIIASTKLMHWLLNYLRIFGDGISIILLTVLVRGAMFPISRKQAYFSVKMQELAPEMKKLQEKYKNDPRAKSEAMMELYRKHNVHPLAGCVPILLQMPIFIGLYFALQESVFFRLASCLWMPNLAAPDMLIPWGDGIPWISDPDNQGGFFFLGPYLNLLPIIAVALMIVQQKVMTPPPQDEQQEMQFKMMRYMMVFFGLMFYKVAAGLCIYFIASSAWGLAERKFLPKKKVPEPAAATGPSPTQKPGQSGKKPGKPSAKTPEKKNGQMQKLSNWWQEVLKQAKKK